MTNYMKLPQIVYIVALLLCRQVCFATDQIITEDPPSKTITIAAPDKTLSVVIDYTTGCSIKQLNVKGKNVLSPTGIYTGIRTKSEAFSSGKSSRKVAIAATANGVAISGITYGGVEETWEFELVGQKIVWHIDREYKQDADLEDMAFPAWHFADLSVWKGGILDNGGMVWCKYLKQTGDTYGVHTGGATFWNAVSGDALRINTKPEGREVVANQ